VILDTILQTKRREVEERKLRAPVEKLAEALADAPYPRDFEAVFRDRLGPLPAVIAEVKKASPSKGVIRADFDPVEIARAYESAGASAISVLTDEDFFQGSIQYLRDVRAAVSLPVLRKDFIIDPYQIVEARAAGADAVLLIVAALDEDDLLDLMRFSRELGMVALVETHDVDELSTALRVGASVIGINNRNLQTFEVSLDTTRRLIENPSLSATRGSKRSPLLISESGIFTREDIEMIGQWGVAGVLIGEALMRERDIAAKLRELIG